MKKEETCDITFLSVMLLVVCISVNKKGDGEMFKWKISIFPNKNALEIVSGSFFSEKIKY